MRHDKQDGLRGSRECLSPTLFTFQKRLATTMEMSRAEFAELGNNPQLKEEGEATGERGLGSMTSCKGGFISTNDLFIPPNSEVLWREAAGCDVTLGRFGSVQVHSTITIHQSTPTSTTGETQKAPNAMIRRHQGLAAVPITLGL